MNIEIYESEPEGFIPQLEAAGCYIEIEGKLLLLQNGIGKSDPGKWGVPAGKLQGNETPESAAKRELFEETGIFLEHPPQIKHLISLYVRKPELNYIYHLFKIHLDEMPNICLSDEHQSYQWASIKDLEEIPLMPGAKEALQRYRITRN